ncbi:GNAT family N-acetyltransferase [Paenactinomyces guangxiensis]|uniref:GNAT family N-acetyltransferase n=1 Tax=Paenactinomyces guangxiensis TaxID=1490290 RepID=A0A7W1WRX2_9BACL|nr:GNAT family N-acetyltransferase [Paenactinomyces guangxiensis]MBA4494950.1 GNAT family N-acetyltransferase [Paenactinomyces guangxiensis]MBH8592033.1 GNAT family N-acetyltransferase [Paenactinomyces guangxiensis]
MRYDSSLEGITFDMLQGGFFAGWTNPPSPETHLKLLQGSYRVVLAIDEEVNQVIGFINAVSDGVLAAYIPLLEVLPAYRGRGIGKELVHRMLGKLKHLYMIDLLCDEELQTYYEKIGMKRASGMMIRNYQNQSGKGNVNFV